MTIPTFTPPIDPSPGTSNAPEVKILDAGFGDGYVQSGPDGLNNIRQILTLRWDVLTDDQAASIVSFMEDQKGAFPFTYALPGKSAVQYTCPTWTQTYNAPDQNAVTATLRQSFAITS